MIEITGPKISVSKAVMPGLTSVKTVGGKKDLTWFHRVTRVPAVQIDAKQGRLRTLTISQNASVGAHLIKEGDQ